MRHQSLPEGKTAEALAVWITDQKKETIIHQEKFPLTEEEIRVLEHTVAQATSALYRLKEIEDLFKEVINGGTIVIMNEDGNPEHQPYDITVPPTKGKKALELNRKFADDQLKLGFRYENTNIYLIPWPEEGKMVAVDIEGKEWPQHTRNMTAPEINANKPLLKQDGYTIKDVLETGDGKVLMMMATKQKTTDPDLSTKDKGFKGPEPELKSDLFSDDEPASDELPFI